ncbi:MAG: alanine racemase [Planctomycetes bacterium]|nr:alanine racemase [Planctomycetota bacterium]
MTKSKAAVSVLGREIDTLDTPALLIDLDVVDRNLATMRSLVAGRGVPIRTHFKSLKCGGLAQYLAERGSERFMAAKLCEAEVLADAGIRDIVIGNQIIGPRKIRRLTVLAERAHVAVCVDSAANVTELSEAACQARVLLGVLVEVDVGMGRCGVATPQEAARLALRVLDSPGLELLGLQGYDGHNQNVHETKDRRRGCRAALAQLAKFRRALEAARITPRLVTTGGTGTADLSPASEAVNEIQPGSYVLMDCNYRKVAPAFGCSLSILTTVISRRDDSHCVLDGGHKAISKDFGLAVLKDESLGRVVSMSEEHTKVEQPAASLGIGSKVEVLSSHCCGTMNPRRRCYAARRAGGEAEWPIEASGRYD